jgi:DNA-binding transcriptional LysR family regulator
VQETHGGRRRGKVAAVAKGAALDWDDLRYFLRAVEAGTMAGAARALGVERTTVARRLTALEQALGTPLVLRNLEGIELTPPGEALLPLAREVERALHAAVQAVTTQKVRVRLATPSGFSRLFSNALARLHQQHPEVALEISSGSTPVDLGKGEADLAIRSGPLTDKDLVARKLFDSEWSLYASADYLARRGTPADLDDLGGHDVVAFDDSFAPTPQAQWLATRLRGASVVMRSREMTDVLTAAVNGAGLAVLPCLFADVEPTLRRLTPAVLATRVVSLVYRREARQSPQVRAVINFVTEVVAERLEQRGR